MTYLTTQIFQKLILRSQFLRLASIGFVLITLQATSARAQQPWSTPDPTTGNIYSINTSGNVGIGTPSPTAKLTVSTNPGTPPTAPLGVIAYFVNADESNTFMTADSYGNGPYHSDFLFRHARGTMAAPTAVQTDDIIGQIQARGYGATAFAATMRAGIRLIAAENWTDSNQGGYLAFVTTPKAAATIAEERVRITDAGNVGIGTTAPSTKLHVVGDVNVTGTGNITASGTIEGGVIKARYQDVAEWVPASEQIRAGTVVVLDSTKSNHVISSTRSYDTRVAGVISAQPGIALGESGDGKVLVATTGRVRIKVDASQGPIHIGDLLVTSDKAGMAMKSEAIKVGRRLMHLPGTLIGKALEPLELGSGTILVLLSLQ